MAKTKITLIGHASVKLISKAGTVVYIDPFFDGDYSEKADIILVSHAHHDHNMIEKCTQKADTTVITWKEALVEGEYKSFDIKDIHVEAVPSGGNKNHPVSENAGYIVTVDGKKLYHAGDCSMFEGLKSLVGKDIDFAMYPCDGVYNMDAAEATKVADMIGAKHNIPIHGFGDKYKEQFKAFNPQNKVVMEYGETIELD